MKNTGDIAGIFLAIVSMLITLIIPLPLSQDFRLAIIGAILIFYIAISIFRFNRRLEEQEEGQQKLKEKLKIHEQLIDIKKNIDILNEKVNKYGEKKRY